MTEETVVTVPDLFDRAIAAHPREAALSRWHPTFQRRVSTELLRREVSRVAAGFLSLGLKIGDRVLLISENRPEWAIIDYATMFAGGILVPVYPSLTVAQLKYLLENSGARLAIASTQALLDKLVEASDNMPNLSQIMVVDQDAASSDVMHLESAAVMGDTLLAERPEAWRQPAARLGRDDVATIIYTSGTTGPPKGVMLSHGNLVSNIGALCEVLDSGGHDTALSYLPLCHVTQRLADYYYFSRGVNIVYVGLEDLTACLTSVRPTTFPGVPRVFEKAKEAILHKVSRSSPILRALFHWAIRVGHEASHRRIEGRSLGTWLSLRHAAADRLVLARVRAGLGGNLRYVVSGGAPLLREIQEFFLAVGIPILEGYGLTESTVLTINRMGRIVPGTVGPPLPGVELRILAGTDAEGGDGEIVARGPGIARGYYLDIRRTDEVFKDGWLYTGDLGRMDAAGNLVITGRKKDLLVTSGGKKVAPALIEQAISASDLVSQIVVVGDGRKYVSALVVPDRVRLTAHCRSAGIAREGAAAFDALLEHPDVRALYDEIIRQRTSEFARFERIKRFALIPSEFTVEGGELTPTLKIKRRVVEEKYKDLIESMYKEG
ncbi:MAG TPA: long-chain fatty acid--CoA ligase [Candidatus Polarisedimenticolia bacterium]|nr:long-chain fatty acid--CoA ligase [Candidatus Polarisedimenticolia bacterium]